MTATQGVWSKYNEALGGLGMAWIRAGKDGRWEIRLSGDD